MQEYASLPMWKIICNVQTSIMEHELGRIYLDTSHVVVHSRNVSGRPDQYSRTEVYKISPYAHLPHCFVYVSKMRLIN